VVADFVDFARARGDEYVAGRGSGLCGIGGASDALALVEDAPLALVFGGGRLAGIRTLDRLVVEAPVVLRGGLSVGAADLTDYDLPLLENVVAVRAAGRHQLAGLLARTVIVREEGEFPAGCRSANFTDRVTGCGGESDEDDETGGFHGNLLGGSV